MLHELVAFRASVLCLGETDDQGDVVYIGPGRVSAFAKVKRVTDGMSVVRGEDDHGIVQHTQNAQALHEMTEPTITHGDFRAIVRLGANEKLFIHVAHVTVSRHYLLMAFLLHVHLQVVRGDEPRLVRIKALHHQEAVFRILVLLQPGHCLLQHPGGEAVLLGTSVVNVHDTLLDEFNARLMALTHQLVRQPVVQLRLRQSWPRTCRIGLLTAQKGPLVEATPEILGRLEHVVDV